MRYAAALHLFESEAESAVCVKRLIVRSSLMYHLGFNALRSDATHLYGK